MPKKGKKDRGPTLHEEEEPTCPHLKTKVTFSSVRNVLPHSAHLCHTCVPKASKVKPSQRDDLVREHSAEQPDGLCVCLKCGFVGCDRTSNNNHATKHAQNKRHPVVMHSGNLRCWCLECDREITPEMSAEVHKCAQFISKHFDHHANSRESDEEEEAAAEPTAASRLSKDRHFSSSLHSSQVDLSRPTTGKGLANLGNTCFFNAVMQCVCRAVPLRENLVRIISNPAQGVRLLPQQETRKNPLPPLDLILQRPVGSLTYTLHEFVEEMLNDKNRGTVSPRPLFQEITRRSPRFRGYQQQDSQELLRSLLDHLEYEQRLRIQDALVVHCGAAPGLSAKEQTEFVQSLPQNDQENVRAYMRSVSTYVDTVFGARLCSTVVCQNCDNVTRTLETCLDISVSIADPVKKRKNTMSRVSATRASRLAVPDGSASSSSTMTRKQQEKLAKQQAKLAKKEAKQLAKQQKKKGGSGGGDVSGDDTSSIGSASETTSLSSMTSLTSRETISTTAGSRTHSRTSSWTSDPPSRTHSRNPSDVGVGGIILSDGVAPYLSSAAITAANLNGVPREPSADVVDGIESLTVREADGQPIPDVACTDHDEDSAESAGCNAPIIPGTVVDPYVPKAGECSVQSCLTAFCVEEYLDGDNLFSCENCAKLAGMAKAADKDEPPSIKSPATKQMLIEQPPRVLTLHLKRFEQRGWHLQKSTKHVTFPMVLDLAPFCSRNVALSVYSEGDAGIRYSLFGVVEHQGRLHSGHYICHVREHLSPEQEPEKARWFTISDSHVRPCSLADVKKAQAYLLFYERVH